jgi:HTH-type transcriptional regulator/antitoxin HigA
MIWEDIFPNKACEVGEIVKKQGVAEALNDFIKMRTKGYTAIENRMQYDDYCRLLEQLLESKADKEDEIEHLTFLIGKWDEGYDLVSELYDPVTILKSLMEEHKMTEKDLTEILGLSKGTISKILNYHKGMSKETIRKLSQYFKLSQDIFNRPYNLVAEPEAKYHKTKNN